jgi:hypothetical protein
LAGVESVLLGWLLPLAALSLVLLSVEVDAGT